MESNDLDNDPRAALESIAEARAAVADRLVTPWWYHPILGVLLGLYLVAVSYGGPALRVVAVAVLLAGLGLLTRAYRRLTGVWISGLEAGRASRWAWAMGGAIGVCMAAGFALAATGSPAWLVCGLGGVVAVAVVVFGRRFDTVLRAELRSEP